MHFKGDLHPKPKLSMFCVPSQNYQHCFEVSWKKSSEKLKNYFRILEGHAVIENSILHVLINNSKIVWATKI